MWCVSNMCTQIPTDVLRLIRSFANEHDVLTERDVFLTAIYTLQKVSPFISVRFRSGYTSAIGEELMYLLHLGAMVPKDGGMYHYYRGVRSELMFAREQCSWRPSSIRIIARYVKSGPKFPYI